MNSFDEALEAGRTFGAAYAGHIAALRGKTALVRKRDDGTLLAQFDDVELISCSGMRLGYGWHAFPRSDFRLAVLLPANFEART